MTPTKKKRLTVGEACFVCRPDGTFAGTVIDLHKDRVRVAGGTRDVPYDEWFPISSKLLSVEPA